jgi:hypothetical protein
MNVLVLTSSMTVAGTLPTTTKVLTVKAPRITSLCTEGAVTGFVVGLPVGGTTVIVASDGESRFDPWGFGADTIEQIALDSIWVGRASWTACPGCTIPPFAGANICYCRAAYPVCVRTEAGAYW